MSLNRYHNSRSSDNVFKLLHEESSYLDILKGNVKAVYKDEVEEEIHSTVRQQLLHEQEGSSVKSGVESDINSKQEEEKDSEDDVEKAGDEAQEIATGEKVKEDMDMLIERGLEDLRLAVGLRG